MTPDHINDDSNHEKLDEFNELMTRWDIRIPEEVNPKDFGTLILDWCKTKYQRPQDALQAMKEDRNIKEAAAVVFGYCYAEMQPFGFPLESSRSDKLLLYFRDEFSNIQIIYDKNVITHAVIPCVDVMLAAARAILLFSGQKIEYDLDFDILLSGLYETIKHGGVPEVKRFASGQFLNDGQSISGDVVGFLSCLACGVVCECYAQLESNYKRENERKYESALGAYVNEIKCLEKAGLEYTLFSALFAGEEYQENLEVDEGKFQDPFINAIKAWEHLKNDPNQLPNWDELRDDLIELSKFSDSDECGPDGIPDFVYFPSQISFCEAKLSLKEVYQILKKQDTQFHVQRFCNDYLEELWDYLEENTRQRLLNAETSWYTKKPPISVTSAFKDYAVALEQELWVLLFEPVSPVISKILQKKGEYRNLLNLSTPPVYRLYLSDMGKILRYLGENRNKIHPDFVPIQRALSDLSISVESKTFLIQTQFATDLVDIYLIKNSDIHPVWPKVLPRASELRKRILGIGNKGYLANIANIKRQLNDVNR